MTADWLWLGQPVPVPYPGQTAAILDWLLPEQRSAIVSSQPTLA